MSHDYMLEDSGWTPDVLLLTLKSIGVISVSPPSMILSTDVYSLRALSFVAVAIK